MRNMVPLFEAPPPIVPPYRFPSFPSTSEVGFDPSAQSDAEQKLCNSLNSPNLLILKITPAPRAPPLAVAPYRNPSLPSTRLPTGKLPLSVESRIYRVRISSLLAALMLHSGK